MGSFPFIYTIKPIEFDGINEVKYIFNLYAQYFSNGLIVVISSILYVNLGFVFLYALLSYINQKFSYNMMVGLGIVIYLMSYIGFKINTSSLSLVLFNNYLLIHQALFNNSLYVFALIIIIEISTISFSFFKSYSLKRGNRDESYRN